MSRMLSMIGGGLLVLLGLALPVIIIGNDGSVSSHYKWLYGLGLALVIALYAMAFYMNATFDGVFDSRGSVWQKLSFFLVLGWVGFLYWMSAAASQLEGMPNKATLPSLFVSVMLVWYGFTMLFGTFFLGLAGALLFSNPVAWLRHAVKRRNERSD